MAERWISQACPAIGVRSVGGLWRWRLQRQQSGDKQRREHNTGPTGEIDGGIGFTACRNNARSDLAEQFVLKTSFPRETPAGRGQETHSPSIYNIIIARRYFRRRTDFADEIPFNLVQSARAGTYIYITVPALYTRSSQTFRLCVQNMYTILL